MTVAVPTSAYYGANTVPVTGMLGSIPKYATAALNVAPAAPASLITPMPGALNAGQTQFTWNSGVGGTPYILSIGSSAGASDIARITTSRQSLSANIPSNIPAAYVTLQSLTPAGWLQQQYTFWLPTLPANSTATLGRAPVYRNGPAYQIASPLASDTIIGCGAPPGVTTSIGSSATNPSVQAVSVSASPSAPFGAASFACTTQAGMTLTAEADIEGFGTEIDGVTAAQTGPGNYHIAVSGFGFGDEEGSLFFSGGPTNNVSWSDTDVEFDTNTQDGVCGDYQLTLDPGEYDESLPIDDFGPQAAEIPISLCPDVSPEPPTIAVTQDGSGVAPGSTVWISAAPALPHLVAALTPSAGGSISGNVGWQAQFTYIQGDYVWTCTAPGAQRVLPSTSQWDLSSELSGICGGQVAISAAYRGANLSFTFNILGKNPTANTVKAALGTNPWFLQQLVNLESQYIHFLASGQPHYGPPNGFGIMQLDPPGSTYQIWDWTQNMSEGVSRLNAFNALTYGAGQLQAWNSFNQANPATSVGPPVDQTEGPCVFSINAPNGGAYPFSDAIWSSDTTRETRRRHNLLDLQPTPIPVSRRTSRGGYGP